MQGRAHHGICFTLLGGEDGRRGGWPEEIDFTERMWNTGLGKEEECVRPSVGLFRCYHVYQSEVRAQPTAVSAPATGSERPPAWQVVRQNGQPGIEYHSDVWSFGPPCTPCCPACSMPTLDIMSAIDDITRLAATHCAAHRRHPCLQACQRRPLSLNSEPVGQTITGLFWPIKLTWNFEHKGK